MESDALPILVHHLDELDSGVSNFEDRETIKSKKSSKFHRKLASSTSKHGKMASRRKALTAEVKGFLQSKELLGALKISHQSFLLLSK